MKLYSLIWSRYVASQMTKAKVANATLAATPEGRFAPARRDARLPGVERVMASRPQGGEISRPLAPARRSRVEKTEREQKFTRPPARYSKPA